MLHVATVFAPAVGALIVGFLVRVLTGRQAHLISCAFMALSAICGLASFLTIVYHGPEKVLLLEWIAVGSLESEWTLRVDALTGVMFFVVSFVSFLIHVYSLGYMEGAHDPHIPRFMCYLSMFTFFMLMLVSADSIVQLFFGWEGVGLASYLLIGFWYTRPSANAAAIKAFIVNRVADFAFMLGIAAMFMVFDSVQFDVIFADAAQHQNTEITVFGATFQALDVVALLLFIGAMGKSAQLGLHTWLPDAMEGPTPVSALIHAATMVTAGVFMVCRLSPLFELAPIALQVVTLIGAATAFFAATIGLTQFDIKRVVAYSTCSQLGYMFFAAGVGFAGFHSKDSILEAAFGAHSQVGMIAYWLGIAGAFMTAFYSARLMFLTFYGKYRGDHHTWDHAHESPPVILIPLYVLAAGAVAAGLVAYSWFVGHDWMAFWGQSIAVK